MHATASTLHIHRHQTGADGRPGARSGPRPRRARGSGLLGPILCAVAIAAVLVAISALPTALDARRGSVDSTTTVSVKRTDTLWAIARAHPVPGEPTSRTVERIRELNRLERATLQPGMVLRVPVERATDVFFAGAAVAATAD